MLRKIHLHGRLGAKFGEVIELDVATAAEALRALNVNFEGFLEELREGAYRVVRGTPGEGYDLDEDEVKGLKLGSKDLHFVPVIEGSKSSAGLVKTVLGVALIGAAVFTAGGGLAGIVGSGGMLGGVSAGNLGLAGIALTLSGVARLLTPTSNGQTFKSSIFSVGTTSQEGSPVPLVYGRFMAQPVLVSAGLDVEQVAPNFTTSYPGQNYPPTDENGGTINGH